VLVSQRNEAQNSVLKVSICEKKQNTGVDKLRREYILNDLLHYMTLVVVADALD